VSAVRILALCGSLRSSSTNMRLLEAVGRCMPEAVRYHSYGELHLLPHFNPDDAPERSEPVSRLVNEVKAADALIVSTPEYARGYPGSLKNALDWLVGTDAFVAKPFVLLDASGRSSHARNSLIVVLETMSGVHVAEASVSVPLLGRNLGVAEILRHEDHAGAIRSSIRSLLSFVEQRS